MEYCRGPLPAGHPARGVTYFCVDNDVAAGACNLAVTPPVETLRHVSGPCVLLDAHRAPDEWIGIALTMPQLIIQGDPDSIRPVACNAFAAELEKQPAPPGGPRVHLECVARLSDAIPMVRGKHIVLVGRYEDVQPVYRNLRPDGMLAGDTVCDMYGRSCVVSSTYQSPSHIFVDDGRRALRRSMCTQHLVVSPCNIRAGEYDTVVVMPGVSQRVGRAVGTRCRYMLIGVSHSPCGYI